MIPFTELGDGGEVAVQSPPNAFLFEEPQPHPDLRVSVIVPVRNEAAHLRHTLDALRLQEDSQGKPLSPDHYEVLLLANNCTDRSYDLATQYQAEFPNFGLYVARLWLSPPQANIGYVRRLLMDEACRRLLLHETTNGIIASTDGDTVVDRHWICQNIAEIEKGNDAVGGRILTQPTNRPGGTGALPERTRRYHLWDVTYRHLVARLETRLDPSTNDPWPRHFQHFGASLAVTCAAYLRAGRLPTVPYLEDEAFYRALLRIDARVRQSPAVRVFTSTRLTGRVAVGFSWQLQQWADLGVAQQIPKVNGLEALVRRFSVRRQLRDAWQLPLAERARRVAHLAGALEINHIWLAREIAGCPYFGQLWERVEERLAQRTRPEIYASVSVTTAIRDLRRFLSS